MYNTNKHIQHVISEILYNSSTVCDGLKFSITHPACESDIKRYDVTPMLFFHCRTWLCN